MFVCVGDAEVGLVWLGFCQVLAARSSSAVFYERVCMYAWRMHFKCSDGEMEGNLGRINNKGRAAAAGVAGF